MEKCFFDAGSGSMSLTNNGIWHHNYLSANAIVSFLGEKTLLRMHKLIKKPDLLIVQVQPGPMRTQTGHMKKISEFKQIECIKETIKHIDKELIDLVDPIDTIHI